MHKNLVSLFPGKCVRNAAQRSGGGAPRR
jgi:hypothetical protein